MKKILVTGATGFIGSCLVRKLLANGDNKVIVFVRDRNNLERSVQEAVQVHEGDICDKVSVKEIDSDIDIVFHLAAKFPQGLSSDKEENRRLYEVNVEGTRNVLEALSPGRLRHFIFFSSVSVYDGIMTEERIDELTEVNPDNAYGQSKLAAEGLVRDFGQNAGVKTTVLRVPFVYGAGNKRNIFRMMEAVDHGKFFLIGPGRNLRSGIYVDNLVEAAILVVNKDIAGDKTYIVTDDRDYTLKELYEEMSKALGRKPAKIYIPFKLGRFLAAGGDLLEKTAGKQLVFNSDVLRRLTRSFYFSSKKICREVGYKPENDFCSTIDRVVAWYKNIT